MSDKIDFVCIGGGPGGFFAAINYATLRPKASVVILESGTKTLRKVKVSGGGRCNLTNACFNPKEFVENYPRGRRELLGPINEFGPQDTIDWFESNGVETKIESDGRVFPLANKSSAILSCLNDRANKLEIEVKKKSGVKKVTANGEGFTVELEDGATLLASKVLLATGSAEIGHTLAASLGHKIVPPSPSLFTFNIEDKFLEGLEGVSFENVEVTLEKSKFKSAGALMITHWGLSGPSILKLSAFAARALEEADYGGTVKIDFLPKINRDELLKKFSLMAENSPKKVIESTPRFGFSKRFWHKLLETVPSETVWAEFSLKMRNKIADAIKNKRLTLDGRTVHKEEFVTCGGVQLKEVNFKTMESKKQQGLYIVGELLDIDGLTGGFNFQNAWTTAFLAARHAASETTELE